MNDTSTVIELDYATYDDQTGFNISVDNITELSIGGVIGGNCRINSTRAQSFVDSIKQQGVLQPLIVRPSSTCKDKVELIAGYGRWNTAKELGVNIVPVILRIFTDQESLQAQLSENLQRKNLSIVDEAVLARKYISLCDGDYSAAAISLNVSERMLRDRLQISRATSAVLSELNNPDSPITLGHTLILSQFDQKLQNSTLQSILENPTHYTVNTLKSLAKKRKLPLSKALFDTTACKTCKHNTGEQLTLIPCEDDDGSEQCAKVSCFNEKSIEWTRNTRKKELEDKFGTVIFISEKEPEHVNYVSESVLGEDQVKACNQCSSKVVILNDLPMNWGKYVVDQCIDLDCFKTCRSNFEKASQPETKNIDTRSTIESTATSDIDTVDTPKTITPTIIKDAAVVTPKIKKSIQEDYDLLLQQAGVIELKRNLTLQKAMTLASICKTSGFKPEINAIDTSFFSFNEFVNIFAMALSNDEMDALMAEGVIYHAEHSLQHFPQALMAQWSENDEVVSLWMPTKKRLNLYSIEQLQALCREFKIDETMPDNKFNAIFNGRKSDVVDAILNLKFDWSNACPTEYLNAESRNLRD